MPANRCPACNAPLTREEVTGAMCPLCGATLTRPVAATEGSLASNPTGAQKDSSRAAIRTRMAALALIAVFVASLFAPYGAIDSIRIALGKGNAVCAETGCTQPATTKVEYSKGVSRGYCPDHAHRAPATLSRKQMAFPIVALAAFVGFFVLPYAIDGFKILTGTPGGSSLAGVGRWLVTRQDRPPPPPDANPPSPRLFAVLTLVGVVGASVGLRFVALYLC